MPEHKARELGSGEQSAAIDTLVHAFERDPLSRWLYPDGRLRRANHTQLFGDLSAQAGALVDVTDSLEAAAIWLPPAGRPDLEAPPAARPAVEQLFDLLRALKADGDFWYLAFLGARTAGTGAGSALLRHRLAALDGPVALWTGNEANLAFYTRFGFTQGQRIDVPGASAWWMNRLNAVARCRAPRDHRVQAGQIEVIAQNAVAVASNLLHELLVLNVAINATLRASRRGSGTPVRAVSLRSLVVMVFSGTGAMEINARDHVTRFRRTSHRPC